MSLFKILVYILLYLFLLYTAVYIAQWLLGLCFSVQKLSRIQEEHDVAVAAISPEDAREMPVTVLIPAHNEQARILSTIESLRGCGYPNLQIIAVDDGSTDDTAQKVQEAYGLHEVSLPPVALTLHTERVRSIWRREDDDSLLLIRK